MGKLSRAIKKAIMGDPDKTPAQAIEEAQTAKAEAPVAHVPIYYAGGGAGLPPGWVWAGFTISRKGVEASAITKEEWDNAQAGVVAKRQIMRVRGSGETLVKAVEKVRAQIEYGGK